MDKNELYTKVTNTIIEALESGADAKDWKAPWHTKDLLLPQNLSSHKAYRGVNTWVLWSEQAIKGYTSNVWGTYKQWAEKGCQVRKGQKATTVILWKPSTRKETKADGTTEEKKSLFSRAFSVFNADQVDGYEAPEVEEIEPFVHIEAAKEFFESLGADLTHGGNSAHYTPAADKINLPTPESFTSPETYYSVSAHEHTHWTSHVSRCDRSEALHKAFGTAEYAAEELVAELGSAYVCALLGIENEPREDHAQYIASWITLLKSDPSAIIKASSKAQQAVDWLVDHAKVTVDA